MVNAISTRTFVPAVLVAAMLLLGGIAEASHSWGGYHWARTSNPFPLQLGDNVTSAWDGYLTTASTDWNASDVLDIIAVAGSTGRNCKAVAGTVQVCNSKYGYNGWLGLAQIWLSGSHITKGVAKMNDSYFNLAAYNNPDEKQHVMCQEIGHTLGLGHTTEDGSSQGTCMDYSSSPSSTHPNQHDYDELGIIYAHLDSFDSYLTSSSDGGGGGGNGHGKPADVGQGIDFSDRSEWGKEVSRSANGRESVFERDLGNGNKVVTHVLWVE